MTPGDFWKISFHDDDDDESVDNDLPRIRTTTKMATMMTTTKMIPTVKDEDKCPNVSHQHKSYRAKQPKVISAWRRKRKSISKQISKYIVDVPRAYLTISFTLHNMTA